MRRQARTGRPQQRSPLWAFRQAPDGSGLTVPLKDTHTERRCLWMHWGGNEEPFTSPHPLGMSHWPPSPVTSVPTITPSTSSFKTWIAMKMFVHGTILHKTPQPWKELTVISRVLGQRKPSVPVGPWKATSLRSYRDGIRNWRWPSIKHCDQWKRPAP